MKTLRYYSLIVVGLVSVLTMLGCTYGAMKAPTSAGMVVYTRGASLHTATIQIAKPADEVYAAMLRAVANYPEKVTLVNNDEKSYLLELTHEGKRLTGQAMELDANSTLFFIWADTGTTGESGKHLAETATRTLCKELKIECKMKDM
ncbi:MAG: hypothetical protein OEU74_03635 [Gammaproteobacteria bacterium]|nr:hypothetical protein [Gammaproteobacteria bacterium]